MKWKKYFTAEEAVMVALGIEHYGSFANAESALSELESDIIESSKSTDDRKESEPSIVKCRDEVDALMAALKEAREINEALLTDIELSASSCDSLYEAGTPPLVLVTKFIGAGGEGWLIPERCTMTKQSLAEWFWPHEKDMAKNIWSGIQDKLEPPTKKEKPLFGKTENSYLRLIKVLSHALIGEAKGNFKKDAEAVLKSIESAGKNNFVVSRETLQKYLEEADDL